MAYIVKSEFGNVIAVCNTIEKAYQINGSVCAGFGDIEEIEDVW